MTEVLKSPHKSARLEELRANPVFGRLQSLVIMLVVGAAFTVAMLVMLANFTQPTNKSAASAVEVASPFADDEELAGAASLPNEETCQVMSTTIKDINARMSEGVTEQQARYFRSRRNKLYQMMRERCGV